jgi:PAS domain S-box-containing protein
VKFDDQGQSVSTASFFKKTDIQAESIADTIREPLLVLGNGLHVLSANRAFYETFHVSPEVTIHRPLSDIQGNWSGIPGLPQLLDEVLATKQPVWDYELEHDFPGLGRRVLILNARVLSPDETSSQTDTILLAITDATDHRDGEASLRESEQRYRLMAQEVIDYAIFSLDTEGRVVTWSEGAYRMKQYTEEEILGEHFRILYPEEDRERHKPENELETVVREGRIKDFGWRRKKDGTLFWAEVVITGMHDASGHLIGFGKVVRDLTETKRIAEEREQLREFEMQMKVRERERVFLRDVLLSVTNSKLILCASPSDLPAHGESYGKPVPVSSDSMSRLRRLSLKGAQAQGFNTERTQDLVTAVGEAAMNAVVHGNGGEGTVCVIHRESGTPTLQVWVEDKGHGMSLEHIPRATLVKGHSTAGSLGHGFFLMLQTVDRVWLLTSTAGTTVVLEQDQQEPYADPWA